MPGLREPMRNRGMAAANKGTLSDFGMLFNHTGLSGACDIDFVYEKGGYAILGEGKEIYDGSMQVPVGQFLMLKAFHNMENIDQVFFVGHQKGNPYHYFITGFANLLEKGRYSTKTLPSGNVQKVFKIDIQDMAGPFSERAMANKVNNYVFTLNENHKKAKFNSSAGQQ